MSNPNRSPKKGFIFPTILLITLAAFFLTSFGIALATQAGVPLYLPLILRNAAGPATPVATSTATPTVEPTPTGSAEPGKVSIANFAFQPAEITVHVGEKVEWENNDPMSHTVTSNTGVWDSGVLPAGEKFSFTFTAVGDFPYHCSLHAGMNGTVHVVANP